jgi:hypothetical protein
MSNHKNIIIPKINKPRNNPNGKSEPDQEPSETRQYVLTCCSVTIMNKGIILAQSDVESCNYTPHKKNHTEASNSENLYFAGRVRRDTNP